MSEIIIGWNLLQASETPDSLERRAADPPSGC